MISAEEDRYAVLSAKWSGDRPLILLGGEIGDFVVMDGGIITVNTDTAATLGMDYSVFNSMANTIVPVTTAE